MREEVSTYRAIGSLTVKDASAAAIASAYQIEVRFLGGLTATQQNAFKHAADRWSKVIVGDLPSVRVNGEVIDDLVIDADGVAIDGPGSVLGAATPTVLRPAAAGASAFLPAMGMMQFDSADLARMEADGSLADVIAHEMGHVIGIGAIWEQKDLLSRAGGADPLFTGTNTTRAYGELAGAAAPLPAPVENEGGPGTRDSHWRESVFGNELMSGYITAAGNPLSKVTIASLKDLGYVVDMAAAEPYRLPRARARVNALIAGTKVHQTVSQMAAPTILSDDSLDI